LLFITAADAAATSHAAYATLPSLKIMICRCRDADAVTRVVTRRHRFARQRRFSIFRRYAFDALLSLPPMLSALRYLALRRLMLPIRYRCRCR